MAKSWNGSSFIDSPTLSNFYDDIEAICRKYDISISHEDQYGAFIIKKGFHKEFMDWFRRASAYGWKDGE